jgi:hypothetical protein
MCRRKKGSNNKQFSLHFYASLLPERARITVREPEDMQWDTRITAFSCFRQPDGECGSYRVALLHYACIIW